MIDKLGLTKIHNKLNEIIQSNNSLVLNNSSVEIINYYRGLIQGISYAIKCLNGNVEILYDFDKFIFKAEISIDDYILTTKYKR